MDNSKNRSFYTIRSHHAIYFIQKRSTAIANRGLLHAASIFINGNNRTNANNAFFLTGNHYLVKSRIPSGVVFSANGSVDAAATVSSESSVPLLKLDWSLGLHCSCRGTKSAWKGAYVSIDRSGGTGIPSFTGEIFYVNLSSTADHPVVQRLAHHRSDPDYIAGLPDGMCSIVSYWMQPHATVSPDGKQIIFGSSWGPTCRAESYVMDISGIRTSANTVHPAPSKTIQEHGIRLNHAQLFDCMGRRIFMRAHETAADFMQRHQGVYLYISPDGIKRISGIAD